MFSGAPTLEHFTANFVPANSAFGVVMGSRAIVSERRTRRDGEVELVLRGQNEFLKLYVNRTALLKVPGRAVTLEDGQVVNPMRTGRHNVMKLWLESRARREYCRIVFNPRPADMPGACGEDELNLWHGFKLPPDQALERRRCHERRGDGQR